jgi:hypothetical protein
LELSGKTILRITMSLNQGALLGTFDRALTTGDYYGSEHIQWDASGGNDLAYQDLSARADFIALCKRYEDLLRSNEAIIGPSRPGP